MQRINADRMLPIRDEIYLQIRKAILRGDYKPGERLQEEQLAAELGVSRTPVREALRKLEVENMVVHYPHRGTVVSEISIDEVEELYEIRTLIEAFLAKRAALRATPEEVAHLHHLLDLEEQATNNSDISDAIDAYNAAVIDAAQSPILADLSNRVRETLSRMIIRGHLHPERRPIAQKEHREIVNAIGAGNSELAQSLTIQHLQNASRSPKPDVDISRGKGEK